MNGSRSKAAVAATVASNVLSLLLAALMLALMIKNDIEFNEHRERMTELAQVLGSLPVALELIDKRHERLAEALSRIVGATEQGAERGAELVGLQKQYLVLLKRGRPQDRAARANLARKIEKLRTDQTKKNKEVSEDVSQAPL